MSDLPTRKGKIEGQRVVAFLDILGFKKIVGRWLENRAVAYAVEQALTKAIDWVGGRKAFSFVRREDWHIRVFSDCICISQPASALGLLEITEGVACFQREMIAAGFPVRGGISVGPHFESELAMLSPALIEAYEIESNSAVFPRVVFSPSAIELLNAVEDDEIRKEIKEFVTIDDDGSAFVCYLIFEEDDPWLKGHRFYTFHQSVVEAGLAQFSEKDPLHIKYDWMGQFHNWCLKATAQILKRSGETEEDEVWSFNTMLVRGITETMQFKSLLWSDRAFVALRSHETYTKVDWVKEWPGAISEDDEEEPDLEQEDF